MVNNLPTDNCRHRGYKAAHIWSCPPQRGDAYIFHRHPPHQRTPGKDRLRVWYEKCLEDVVNQGIATEVVSLYDEYFTSEGKLRAENGLPPFFDGDYWTQEAKRVFQDLGKPKKGKKGKKQKAAQSKPSFASSLQLREPTTPRHDFGLDSPGVLTRRQSSTPSPGAGASPVAPIHAVQGRRRSRSRLNSEDVVRTKRSIMPDDSVLKRQRVEATLPSDTAAASESLKLTVPASKTSGSAKSPSSPPALTLKDFDVDPLQMLAERLKPMAPEFFVVKFSPVGTPGGDSALQRSPSLRPLTRSKSTDSASAESQSEASTVATQPSSVKRISCDFFDTRTGFLRMCQGNNYQVCYRIQLVLSALINSCLFLFSLTLCAGPSTLRL